MILRAGPFHITYENGFLRYLSHGDTEILRMIYFTFRDENWGTLDKVIEEEEEETVVETNAFLIRYKCFHLIEKRKVFEWNVEIQGFDTGELSFNLAGIALEATLKNRVGFCIHHPIRETIGQPVEITQPDSSTYRGQFPEHIAPHNPFRDIASMRWRCAENWYQLHFEGDIFETEDQRNWTDASFKTYCTPLEKPFPVMLEKGQKIVQKVRFVPEKRLQFIAKEENNIRLSFTGPAVERLSIGTFLPKEEDALPFLAPLGVNHYRVDIWPEQMDWQEVLENAGRLLYQQPARIALYIHNGFKIHMEPLLYYLRQNHIPVFSITLLPGTQGISEEDAVLFNQWEERYPGFLLGAGTDYNFAELNRNRLDSIIPDFVNFSIHPQEHAFDDRSLIENLAAQADTVRTIKHLYGSGCRVHLSAVTFKKRFNPYATDPSLRCISIEAQTDERQYSPFGAVWTLGSIKYLSMGGARSAIYFQGTGKLGILGSDLSPSPLSKALALYHKSYPSRILTSESGSPLFVDGLFFENGAVIVWNYTPEQRRITLPDGQTILLKGYDIRESQIRS